MSGEQSGQAGAGLEETAERPSVNLDTILVQEVGQFGLFQLKTIALAAIIVIFMSWGANEYIFTTARINTRCLIPECDAEYPIFDPPWLPKAIPDGASCERFANASVVSVIRDICPVELFDHDTIVSCEQQLYENQNTVVYDYDLGCQEWLRSLIGTLRTLGTLTALPIVGFISDRWGRRTALTLSALNTGWLGATRYFANTYTGFVISEFAESTFGSGGFSSAYILVTEVVGPKFRVATGATMNTFFSVGQILMGLIAWGVPNWRHFTLVLYLPQLLSFVYFWIITESVRWYMSKGRYEDSEKVLKSMARMNRRQLSDKSLKALRATAEEEKRIAAIEKAEKSKEPWLIVLVFRHKQILYRCLISPVWWITNTFIYYGMSINAINMSGNRYVNYIAVAAAQIPGYWTAMVLLDLIGRKPTLIGAYWICALCQVAYIFMPADAQGFSLAVYLIGTFSSAAVMTSVYVYTTELYPTKYRHSLFAFSSMVGRIGSMLAPLTPALGTAVWEKLPFALFGGLALLSGALIFLTPETKGVIMPDTMEEASNIGNKRTARI